MTRRGPCRKWLSHQTGNHPSVYRRGDVKLMEVSTPELDDVIRLEDRYGREGTSPLEEPPLFPMTFTALIGRPLWPRRNLRPLKSPFPMTTGSKTREMSHYVRMGEFALRNSSNKDTTCALQHTQSGLGCHPLSQNTKSRRMAIKIDPRSRPGTSDSHLDSRRFFLDYRGYIRLKR